MAPITLTDARITAPLLAALMYFPARLQSLLPPRFRSWVTSPLFLKAVAFLLGIDVLRKTNNALSRYVANNGRRVDFVPSRELVLITGGASGIGLLMARDFANRGVKVVILDLNPPREHLPPNVYFYRADVTSVAEIAETAAAIRKDHGDPTVLINNAGIGTLKSIIESEEKNIQDTFNVNTVSHFWMAREFVPAMIKRNHGHVVTIASMASYVVHAMNVDYCCSKASALTFHEGLSSELRNIYNAPNVRTTVVNPSWIRTPLTERMLKDKNWKAKVMEPEYVTKKIVDQVMFGRGGQLVLPPNVNFVTTIRAWPVWLQTMLRNSIGKELKMVRDSLELAGA
ncbi:hypothetical protein K3495_g11904 [Podosphaera aphanis]|nr:hypothetical protein K3495_g11904 [Podosphaera aphanis]